MQLEAGEKLFTIPEFAERLRKKQSGVRRWVLERRIAVIKVGRNVRIPESELRRIVSEGFRPARQPSVAR